MFLLSFSGVMTSHVSKPSSLFFYIRALHKGQSEDGTGDEGTGLTYPFGKRECKKQDSLDKARQGFDAQVDDIIRQQFEEENFVSVAHDHFYCNRIVLNISGLS